MDEKQQREQEESVRHERRARKRGNEGTWRESEMLVGFKYLWLTM